MTRWLPRSLFGRLMLVLASGLIVAQLLSAAINLLERDSALVRASGMQPAQRIADIVALLESLNPAERERIVAILNVPPLVVSLDRVPPSEDSQVTGGAHATMFAKPRWPNAFEVSGPYRPQGLAPSIMPAE